ncbi:MAG: threonine--tRNA ligase, partial [Clostridia bacterium]|nr:threonine--tRNA ligase [Clostridia bacterium]
LHRAILGSLDRFMAYIIEETKGKFPVWLSPVQVKVLTLPGTDVSFAKDVYEKLSDLGIRAALDDRNEKIGYKVREARQDDRVPYMLIIGANEIESRSLSVRDRDTDQTTGMTVDAFIEKITGEITARK